MLLVTSFHAEPLECVLISIMSLDEDQIILLSCSVVQTLMNSCRIRFNHTHSVRYDLLLNLQAINIVISLP
jgi:hypothetical protein